MGTVQTTRGRSRRWASQSSRFCSRCRCRSPGRPVGTARRIDDGRAGRRADQEALKPYAGLVGGWKNGVGQVERGRARGAWTESAAWAWKLSQRLGRAGGQGQKGKYLKSGLLRPGKEPGTYAFEATLADGSTRTLHRQADGTGAAKPLVLTADAKAPAEGLRRVTITPLHDTRLLVLLEAAGPRPPRLLPARRGRLHPRGGRLRRGRVVPALHRHRGAGDDPGQLQGQDLLGLLLRLPRPLQREPRGRPRRGRRAREGQEEVGQGARGRASNA